TAPVFVEELPADVTVECSEVADAVVLTATDNCGDTTVNFNETTEQGDCEGSYTITRTWTAVDACGNEVSHVQTINVQDTTAPEVLTPYDEVINVFCDNIPEIPTLEFIDICSSVTEPIFTEEIVDQTVDSYVVIRNWYVSDSCGNDATFTQTIYVTISNEGSLIESELCIEDEAIDLFTLLNSEIEQGGTWVDVSNSGALDGNNFDPTLVSELGEYVIQYVISDGVCPRAIEIRININDDCVVLPCRDIQIWNAVSPNDDGKNDFFFIENLEDECYTNNTVEIYNRWGVLVYEARNYDNNSRAFRGISEGRATLNKSAELPTGTYYYIIQISTSTGETISKDGYLYLTR
ncbi:MAG: gliding motility-associated C-terminal domain-containing protein, partial [Flavobacteriaceae bacterium]|nr:gliding motility-associated C-terminal domain-containing protein [Flavobacteriaceae bacterium]